MQPPLPDTSMKLVQAGLGKYDVDAQDVVPIRGWNTSVFCITTGKGRFALRLHEGDARPESHLRAELAFLNHLHETGLSVPIPINNRQGTFLSKLVLANEIVFCDLTTWLEGNVRRKRLDQSDAYQLGQNLGHIHDASKTFVLPVDATFPCYDLTMLSPAIAQPLEPWFNKQDRAIVEHIVNQASVVLSKEIIKEDDMGIIHKDYILGNCLWHKGKLSILDFAESGRGLYLYDLATMLTNIGDQASLRIGFIQGHTSVVPLSHGILERLSLLEAIRHVNTILWNIEKAKLGEGPDLTRHLNIRMAEIRALVGEIT
ncbi:MAG: phosphotransferase [Chloroflexota bacterium]